MSSMYGPGVREATTSSMASPVTVNNSTTLVNALSVSVVANAVYEVDILVSASSTVIAGLIMRVVGTATSALAGVVESALDTLADFVIDDDIDVTIPGTAPILRRLKFILRVGSTGGTLLLKFAQKVATAVNTVLHAGTRAVAKQLV